MESFPGRKTFLGFLALLIIGFVAFMVLRSGDETLPQEETPQEEVFQTSEQIGTSVEGRAIIAYTYGNGANSLLFVGGIHGGYEWNSTLLAYQFMDYLEDDPARLPDSLSVTVIPSANPDGLFAVIGKEGKFTMADVPAGAGENGAGRMNANGVDLNRNFDCKWKPASMWRGEVVSAGSEPFSEPEAQALRAWVLREKPKAAVFWHSQANAVYGSECHEGILPETEAILNAYASASGYAAIPLFTSYEVTGDAEGWLASIGIPAITVELKTHETIEWEGNLRGIRALLDHFGAL